MINYKVTKLRLDRLGYRNQGPWIVTQISSFEDQLMELTQLELIDNKDYTSIVFEIIEELKVNPFSGTHEQHPLWQFIDGNRNNSWRFGEFVVWSAKISPDHRLNYLVFKDTNSVLLTNCVDHYVLEHAYSATEEVPSIDYLIKFDK